MLSYKPEQLTPELLYRLAKVITKSLWNNITENERYRIIYGASEHVLKERAQIKNFLGFGRKYDHFPDIKTDWIAFERCVNELQGVEQSTRNYPSNNHALDEAKPY